MRKAPALLIVLCLLIPLCAAAQAPSVGVCIYASRDTFIFGLVSEMQQRAQGKAVLDILYAEGDQNRQNDQVVQLLDAGVDVLVVNPVDRVSAVYIIRLCHRRGVPLIMINREPLPEDLREYDKAYYVGIDPREQGRLQGELAADYFRRHPQADLNGDGMIQLALLRGEPGHQDAQLRSLYALDALRRSGMSYEMLADETANWDKGQGQERVAMMLNTLGEGIELVLSNNDDMALGAIDALKAAGYFGQGRWIPVIGVDATAPALEMLDQGSLYATVQNDAGLQAQAVVDLISLLAQGIQADSNNYPWEMNHHVVYIPSVPITSPAR